MCTKWQLVSHFGKFPAKCKFRSLAQNSAACLKLGPNNDLLTYYSRFLTNINYIQQLKQGLHGTFGRLL